MLAFVAALVALGGCEPPAPDDADAGPDSALVYSVREVDGREVRFYMGRQIAPVTAAHDTTEAPPDADPRAVAEFPDRVVEALELAPGDVVADIGAGAGYFTFRLSPRLPQGRVLAVDIQPAMLAEIERRADAEGIANISTILGAVDDPNLPADSVDVALIVGSYHEFSHPREMIEHVAEALQPGGRLVLVEYRGEDATLPVDPLHTMTQAQARKEIEAAGLVWSHTKDVLPQQHFMIFAKPPG